MKVITLANQKGGVGKTSTALGLYSTLKNLGYKVLALDLDRQCNFTNVFNANEETKEETKGAFSLFIKSDIDFNEVIQHNERGDNFIRGDSNLNDLEAYFNSTNHSINREYKLKLAFRNLKEDYDFLIIDTAPNLNVLTINALNITDYLIVVSNADSFSLEGVQDILTIASTIQEFTNPNLNLEGILINRFSTRGTLNKNYKDVLEDLAKYNKTKVFKTCIRDSITIREAQAVKELIGDYAPKSNSYLDYFELTKELLKDIKKGAK